MSHTHSPFVMFQMSVIFDTQLNLLPMFKSEQILHQLSILQASLFPPYNHILEGHTVETCLPQGLEAPPLHEKWINNGNATITLRQLPCV